METPESSDATPRPAHFPEPMMRHSGGFKMLWILTVLIFSFAGFYAPAITGDPVSLWSSIPMLVGGLYFGWLAYCLFWVWDDSPENELTATEYRKRFIPFT